MIPNITNMTMNLSLNPYGIVKYELVSYNYGFYIAVNFFLILAAFLNERYKIAPKHLDIEYERFNHIISIVLLVFNTCMLLFHFLVIPLNNVLLGV